MHANRSRREVETPAPAIEDQYFIILIVPDDPLAEDAHEPELPVGNDRMTHGNGTGVLFFPHDPPQTLTYSFPQTPRLRVIYTCRWLATTLRLEAAVKSQGVSELTRPHLDGVRMTVAESEAQSVVNASTVFTFEQRGNVVSARYRGGEVVDGYLIGHLEGWLLHFRYVQADRSGRLDSGVSEGVLDRLADGRLRLIEHYQWLTRPERGTNTFEEIGLVP